MEEDKKRPEDAESALTEKVHTDPDKERVRETVEDSGRDIEETDGITDDGRCETVQTGTDEPEVEEISVDDERFAVEEAWAKSLKMEFDAERAATPPPVPPRYPDQNAATGNDVPQPDQFVGAGGENEAAQKAEEREPMPPTYLVWAIICTLCCCMPAGIAAIVFSSSVSTKYFAGDIAGAKRASRLAEIWIIVSIVSGIVINTLYIPMMLLMPQ